MTALAIIAPLSNATAPAIPQNAGGLTSGQLFFIFLLALGGASVLLYRSMKKQLGRIQMPKDER